MKNIEDALNRLTDMDWGWWPLLRLRPGREQPLTTARVALMSLGYGLVYGLPLALALVYASGRRPFGGPEESLVGTVALFAVVFFVLYRLSFAVAWNARARRLREDEW